MKQFLNDAEILDEFQRRRKAFEQLCHRLWNSDGKPCEVFNRCACPACGYPALGSRGNYDMCHLCAWEDDGQDDAEADEVWCGPNGGYSLTEARLNFARFGTMYPPEDPAGEAWLRPDAATERRMYESLLGIADKKALDEQVLVVKRGLSMATTLAESLKWQPLRYDQRRGVIRDDWWLPHVIWEGTSHGRCQMTPDSALREFQKRFDHFQYLCNRLMDKVPQRFGRYPCTACGFPTLDRTSHSCGLCGWDKPAAEAEVAGELKGGPRRDYTLVEAQLNFEKYLTMYRPDDEPYFSPSEANILEKCLLIRAYL